MSVCVWHSYILFKLELNIKTNEIRWNFGFLDKRKQKSWRKARKLLFVGVLCVFDCFM